MTTATKLTGIPRIPNTLERDLELYLRAINDNFEIRLGLKGSSQDRAITLRELIDAGIVTSAPSAKFNPYDVKESTRGFNKNDEETYKKLNVTDLDVTDLDVTDLDVNANSLTIAQSKTPASASASGTQGEIAWDSSYIYVCIADNVWKRVAISTWT
jgi:hypothetical protein